MLREVRGPNNIKLDAGMPGVLTYLKVNVSLSLASQKASTPSLINPGCLLRVF